MHKLSNVPFAKQNTDILIHDHESSYSYIAHRLLDVRGDFDLECCFVMSLWSAEPRNNGLLTSLFIYGLSNEPNEHVKFELEGFQFDVVIMSRSVIQLIMQAIDNASQSASIVTLNEVVQTNETHSLELFISSFQLLMLSECSACNAYGNSDCWHRTNHTLLYHSNCLCNNERMGEVVGCSVTSHRSPYEGIDSEPSSAGFVLHKSATES